MNLYNKIVDHQLAVRKLGAKADAKALTYLLGEIERQPQKDLSDKAVLAVIKSTVKRLTQAHKLAKSEAGLRELQLLQGYLPVELSGIELHYKIRDLDFTTMPEAMRKIKAWDFPVNMGEASKLVREMLK